MTWDITQPIDSLYLKANFKAWRHPSNTAGEFQLEFGGSGGIVPVYASEILPTGQWVSIVRYFKPYNSSAPNAVRILYSSLFYPMEGGPIYLSDIAVSQAADIVTWQQDKTAFHSVSQSDIGNRISITTGGVSIGTNFNSGVPTGAWFEVYNNSDVAQAIVCSVTLRLAASGTTGARTLAGRGLAILNKISGSEWLIHGAGVT